MAGTPSHDGETGRSAGADDRATTLGLVCGDPVWKHAFNWLLRSAGVDVVAHARDLDRALELVSRSAPVVLLVDVDDELAPSRLMRRVAELRHAHDSLRIVIVCSRGEHAAHDAALAGGADAVVWRENAFDLLEAVDAAAQGVSICATRPRLTLRELEVLRLVAEGHTSREVARAMWVTEQTVKYHLANIYRRLHVGNRYEAVAWAREHGVVEPDAKPWPPPPSETSRIRRQTCSNLHQGRRSRLVAPAPEDWSRVPSGQA